MTKRVRRNHGPAFKAPSTSLGEAFAAVKGERTLAELTPVAIHFSVMTAAVRLIMAARLRAVLPYRVAILCQCLSGAGLRFQRAQLGGKACGELQKQFSMR